MQNSSSKKFLISIFFLLFLSGGTAFSDTMGNNEITRIENEIWGYTYENNTDNERLDRIEKKVFGTSYPNLEEQKRIDKITKSLGLETEEDEKKSLADLYVPEQAGQGAEYPIVDSLETTLLGSVYKTDDINTRLERLEKKVFGAKQDGELSDRTEALRRYAGGSSNIQTAMGMDNNYNSYQPTYSPNSDETKLQLAALENLMYGTDFAQDPVALRLTRLENRIFQRDFSEDDPSMRIQRIQAAATAGKTAKYYDNNKFQKLTSTGMQIGTFLLMLLAFIL